MAFTIEQLEPILQKITERNRNYFPTEPDLTYAKEFLTGQTQVMPAFVQSGFLSYFSSFILLVKGPGATPENKQLLFRFFNEPHINQQTQYEVFYYLFGWVEFEEVLSRLKENSEILQQIGWTEKQIAFNLVSQFKRFISYDAIKNEDNDFIKIINKTYRSLTDQELKDTVQYSWDPTLALLLYVHQRKSWQHYIKNNERVEYHPLVNPDVMRFAITYEREAYEKYYYDLIHTAPERTFEDIKIKFTAELHYNEIALIENDLLRTAQLYLEGLHKKEIGYYEDSFSSSKNDIHFSEEYGYMPLSGWALYLLLLAQKEKGLHYLNLMQGKGISFGKYVLEMLYAILKEEAVPVFTEQMYLKSASRWDESTRVDFLLKIIKENKQLIDPGVFWQFQKYKSKYNKDVAIQYIISDDPEAERKALSFLSHKNSEMRIASSRILAQLATTAAMQALKEGIAIEKDDEARDLMVEVAGNEYLSSISPETLPDVIERTAQRGKLKKLPAPWLNIDDLPAVYFSNGTIANTDVIRFLFYRMSRIKGMNSDPEVRQLFPFIDRTKSNPFALRIIKLFFDNKAEAKYKYVLALGALIGDDDVVDKLKSSIEKFVDEGRVKMAESAVGALALQGSNKALRWVEFFSRKYRSKKANVGAAAIAALENAAGELNISSHELGDRIVPDFGFDGLYKTFTVEGDEYRAFIDSNFKIAFFNEDNKKIKSIPAAADIQLKDEFKAIAKEVRDIVKSQSPRLEYYLIIQRRWTFNQWQELFLQNPVMFIYATKLLWAVFDADEKIKQSFVCLEDTSLVNMNNDEIAIDEDAVIGIVHPTQLTEAEQQQWKQQFFDLKIDPVFAQLERRMPELTDLDLSKKIIRKFEGKQMKTGSIRSTLERYGWHKGSTGDGGYLTSMNLLYLEKQLEAVLEIEGVGVGYGWGGEEKTGRLYVIDKTKVAKKWDVYPRNEEDDKLVSFQELPSIFLSELLAAIEAITPVDKTGV